MPNYKSNFLALFACAAMAMPGMAHAKEDQAYMSDLYKKAVEAKKTNVTVYSPFVNIPFIFEEFNKQYPDIKFVHQYMTAAQLTTRLEAERTSGNHAGDIAISGLILLGPLNQSGFFEAYKPRSSEELDKNLQSADGNINIPFINLFGLDYNKTIVDGAALPKSFSELFSGKWKDRIGFSNLRASGASEMCAATLWKNGRFTEEDLRGLKENGVVHKTNTDIVMNLAQGRLAFGLWSPSQVTMQQKWDGAPVEVGYVHDMACTFGAGAGLLKNAPSEDAAKLVLEWFFSKDGQKAMSGKFSAYGSMPGATAPEGYPNIDDLNLTPIPPAEIPQVLADFRKLSEPLWPN